MRPRPHPNCYWVTENLLAGEYPFDDDSDRGEAKLDAILDAGITEFLDLTEPVDGLRRYEDLDMGARFGHRQMAIRDRGVPSPTIMRSILDHLQSRLDEGHNVYLHCWGGIGRTGTVVGCYLIELGMSADQALEHIAQHWTTVGQSAWFPRSPETDEQVEFIRRWEQHRLAP